MKDLIHNQIVKNKKKLDSWFEEKAKGLNFPIYASVDIRDCGIKLASVDANIFPAGFNNICDVDQETTKDLFKNYLLKNYGSHNLKILLLTEEHTSNRYYWENVKTLTDLISASGSEVRVAVPKVFSGKTSITTPKGAVVDVYSALREGDGVKTFDGFIPDLIISNNDFSNSYEEWYKGLKTPINPAYDLGWFKRKKSDHFKFYNQLAEEISSVLDINPWTFTVKTELAEVNFDDDSSVLQLAEKTQKFIDGLESDYKKNKSGCGEPVVFIKNNRGTYGMGIISVRSSEELKNLSSKERKKMGYSKGGSSVYEVILQEGIPTQLKSGTATAEPVIYLVGNKLAGGFMRTHKDKGPVENLNSPGAVFERLCMSDLMVDMQGSLQENVYGLVAKLNVLAIGLESRYAVPF